MFPPTSTRVSYTDEPGVPNVALRRNLGSLCFHWGFRDWAAGAHHGPGDIELSRRPCSQVFRYCLKSIAAVTQKRPIRSVLGLSRYEPATVKKRCSGCAIHRCT